MLYQYILSLDVDCPFILKMASQQNVAISFCSTTIVGELGIDHSTLVVIKSRDGPSFSAITEDSGTTQVMIICAPW